MLLVAACNESAVVAEAAKASLHRIALYSHLADVSSLLARHLGVIVDEACRLLRLDISWMSNTEKYCVRYVSGVLDMVFDSLGYQVFANNQPVAAIIQEVLRTTLEYTDQHALFNQLTSLQVRVM